jgi:vancomycin resistance protein YoaR
MGTEPTNQPTVDDTNPNGVGDDPKPNNLDAILAKNAEVILANKKLREKLDAAEAEKRSAEEKALAENQRYQELWEKEKEEKAALANQLGSVTSEITNAKKFAAFQREVGQAIPEKYQALVDIDKILADDQGNPTAQSVKDYVSSWNKEYGDLFKAPPIISQDNPKGDDHTVPSIEEWQRLNLTDPKKAKEIYPAVFEKHGKNLAASS